MFWNYVRIALRNLRKNKAFAAINISGLAIGMTIYVFGGLLVNYERTHDVFFEKYDRTYTIGATASPELNVGVDNFNSVQSAVGPLIEAELSDVEAVARTILREYLVTMGPDSFYEQIRFADPAFLQIFDFNYIYGDSGVLEDPSALLISETMAVKYFGKTDVVGEVITLDNEFDFFVGAVVEDVPLNSHFSSLVIIDSPFAIVAPIQALNRTREFDVNGNWTNLSIGNMTYVLLPPTLDQTWLQTQMDELFERSVPKEQAQAITSFNVHPLTYANTAVWGLIGIPVIEVISLLSFLVLVVACVNYTNLATAQSLGRSREVGMRKTKPRHRSNRHGHCDCGTRDHHPVVQQRDEQGTVAELRTNAAMAGHDDCGGGPGGRALPGLANNTRKPNRCAARLRQEGQERFADARRRNRCAVRYLRVHAGASGHRLHAERKGEGVELHFPALRNLYAGSPQRREHYGTPRYLAARARSAPQCRSRCVLEPGALRAEQLVDLCVAAAR
jgi:hypothetical protein